MLNEKVVVVSGAGSGLGRELAAGLCAQGARVFGLGRDAAKLESTAAKISSPNFAYFSVDVSDFRALSTVVREILDELGRVDVVFNNAAVYPKVSFLEESAEDWAQAVAINLSGVANVCKIVLPTMLEQGFGRIYNVGSWAHLRPIANSAAYSATKAGVHTLSKAIAADIAHLQADVEVHEWIPGHLNTQMSDYTGIDPAIAARWGIEIASHRRASSKDCLYEQNREWEPPRSFKQRLKKKLMFWR